MSAQSAKTILLVEDDTALAMTCACTLGRFGYTVITADSGEKAAAIAAGENNFDLVLMDIELGGGIDGTEAAKQILLQRKIPIVFHTSHSEREIVEKIHGITRYGYVLKSSGDFVLQSSIEMAFELFDAHQRLESQMSALRESEEKFRLIAENTSDGIIIFGAGNQIRYVSPAYLKQLDYDELAELGRTPDAIYSIIHPDDREAVFQDIFQAIKLQKSTLTYSYRVKHTAGHYIWREDNARFKYDSSGKYDGAYVICRDVTERKRAEEKLRESEEKYRTLINYSSDPIFSFNLDATYKFVNEAFARRFGKNPEEIAGKTPHFLFPPDEAEKRLSSVRKVISTGQKDEIVVKVVAPSGEIFYYVTIDLIKNAMGDVLFISCVSKDITERKLVEDALRIKDWAIESAINAIAIADLTGSLSYVNPAFLRWWGYSSLAETAGRSAADFWQDGDNSAAILESLLTQNRWSGELVAQRKDGSFFDVEVASSVVLDAAGRHICLLASFAEITVRKQTEEALRESKRRFDQLAEQSRTIAWETDAQGLYTYVSHVSEKIFGYRPGELTGRMHFYDLHPDEGREAFKTAAFDIFERKEPFTNLFNAVHKLDGHTVWVSTNGIPLLNADGTLHGYRGSDTDITERIQNEEAMRAAERRMRQAEKMESLGQLAGGIAHDFNNVLAGIIGYTDMSLRYAEKNSKLERNLLSVLKASDRAAHLVRQILTFSRQGNPEKVITSIRPIIIEVLELLRASIPSSVIIESDLQKETQPVLADPAKIHEALLNLATNAVHAMDRKGTLSVQLYADCFDRGMHVRTGEIKPGGYTVIEVSDTGCGMDAETISKAFDPFFTTKAVGEGTGLGLSVVLGVVQSHGGEVDVESIVGKGATFKIYLPTAAESLSGADNNNEQSSISGGERILFVDDEQMLVEIAGIELTDLGFTVTAMSSGIDAMNFLKDKGTAIDILITDQTMPGITGMELAEEALKIRNNLPVIICTGYANEVNLEKAKSMGIRRLVKKPIRFSEFSTIIREVIDETENDLSDGKYPGLKTAK